MKKVILEGLDKSEKIVFKSGNPIYKIPEEFGYKPKDYIYAKKVNGHIELVSAAQFQEDTTPGLSNVIDRQKKRPLKENNYQKNKRKALKPYIRSFRINEEGTIDISSLLDKESVEIELKAKKPVK